MLLYAFVFDVLLSLSFSSIEDKFGQLCIALIMPALVFIIPCSSKPSVIDHLLTKQKSSTLSVDHQYSADSCVWHTWDNWWPNRIHFKLQQPNSILLKLVQWQLNSAFLMCIRVNNYFWETLFHTLPSSSLLESGKWGSVKIEFIL